MSKIFKNALVTGVTGQLGSYLAELLLSKGYHVTGMIRRSSVVMPRYMTPIIEHTRMRLMYGELGNSASIDCMMNTVQPDEIYNLAADSSLASSGADPELTGHIIGLGTVRLLEAMKKHVPHARFFQASSAEMFGYASAPQNELTPFAPQSPYAVAKCFAHWSTVNARTNGMHASCGILFNFESPRRREEFVTRKITKAVARIKMGLQKELVLNNMGSMRDWGFAGDYAEAAWRMLQQDTPDDYVIATGRRHMVREFAQAAFDHAHLPMDDLIHLDYIPRHRDPVRCGKPLKINGIGWYAKWGMTGVAQMMVDADLELAKRELAESKT